MKKLRLREFTEMVRNKAGIQILGLILESVLLTSLLPHESLNDKVKTDVAEKRYK